MAERPGAPGGSLLPSTASEEMCQRTREQGQRRLDYPAWECVPRGHRRGEKEPWTEWPRKRLTWKQRKSVQRLEGGA